jgi:hypothetical protein
MRWMKIADKGWLREREREKRRQKKNEKERIEEEHYKHRK